MMQIPNIGPACPTCKVSTSFMGVDASLFRNAWVEVYQCPAHGHRFEGPVKKNKHDKDYKEPPFKGESNVL